MRLASEQVAVVLAAGRGRRMGMPKALIRMGGPMWWEVQSQRLARAGVPSLWVVSAEVREVMMEAGPPPFRVAVGDPDTPPFESFLAGVRALDAADGGPPPGVFVLPVDVPAPGKPVWQALCDAGRVAVPTFGDSRGHPVFMEWAWIEEVLRPWPGPERAAELRLDSLIAPVATYVNVHDPSVAANLNTPEDAARWLATQGGEPAR